MAQVGLNEILVTTQQPNVQMALRSPLYDIESANTTASLIQATTTENGNEFRVLKTAPENTVETVVPGGVFQLSSPAVTKVRQQQAEPLLLVAFKTQ